MIIFSHPAPLVFTCAFAQGGFPMHPKVCPHDYNIGIAYIYIYHTYTDYTYVQHTLSLYVHGITRYTNV